MNAKLRGSVEVDAELIDLDEGLSILNGGGDEPDAVSCWGNPLGAGGSEAKSDAVALVVGVMRSDMVEDSESRALLRSEAELLCLLSPTDGTR